MTSKDGLLWVNAAKKTQLPGGIQTLLRALCAGASEYNECSATKGAKKVRRSKRRQLSVLQHQEGAHQAVM